MAEDVYVKPSQQQTEMLQSVQQSISQLSVFLHDLLSVAVISNFL